jgi:GNAT superfamily N-acetyltransferase
MQAFPNSLRRGLWTEFEIVLLMLGGSYMADMKDLKKKGKLKDGTEVLLRPMVKADRKAVGDFFCRLPSSVLQYVRHDVIDQKVLDEWFDHLDYDRVFPLLAIKDNKVVANASLHRVAYGWRKHLGTVRIVVEPEFHEKGLGTLMINELVDLSMEFGLEKLMVEFPLKSHSALSMFKRVGFSPRAVIEGLMKNRHGENVDVVIMVMDVAAFAGRFHL